MISRRRFLEGAATATLGVASAACRNRGGALGADNVAIATSPRPGAPRALVHFVLKGGMDAVLTTDPRERGRVPERVDVPYEPHQIFQVGSDSYGPLLVGLAAHLPRTAVVNGVLCSTVSHPRGLMQTVQMRRSFPGGPQIGLPGTLGYFLRGGSPLEDVRMNVNDGDPSSGRSLALRYGNADQSEGMLDLLVALASSDDRRRAAEKVLAAQRVENTSNGLVTDTVADLVESLRDTSLPPIPKLDLPRMFRWTAEVMSREYGRMVRDVLFILEHRIAPVVHVGQFAPLLDSHQNNLGQQTTALGAIVPALAMLLDELSRRRSPDGNLLSDEVAVVISSELGRFPYLNKYQGKDHLPEIPMLFLGPGIRPGKYGETTDELTATPVSFDTGRPSSSRKDAVPTIDDVGVTLLRWFGIEDTRSLGYLGQDMRFLHS